MNVPEKYRKYDELLKTKLDDYRYIHSLGVAKSARHLAELYGADPEKAYFAGLLHDVMKNSAPEEQLQIIEKADIMLSPSERLNRKLWHAIAGAAFLKLDCDLLKKTFDWKPTISVSEAVGMTVEWTKTWIYGGNLWDIMLQQAKEALERNGEIL